jgi:hypothetical protein
MPSKSIAPAVLEEYGAVTRRVLEKYLGVRPARGAEYLGNAMREYPARGGRALRSTVCMAIAKP